MGADITPRISNCVEESISGGETGGDAKEIRGGGGEAANRIFIVHEELKSRQNQKTNDGFWRIHFKQGGQVVAFSIAVHVRLSEPEVAHHTEAYPKRRIQNLELGRQPRNRVPFICRGPGWRENVDVRVRYNPQTPLRYSGHHAKKPGVGQKRSTFWKLW